jgi:hypothetical protein
MYPPHPMAILAGKHISGARPGSAEREASFSALYRQLPTQIVILSEVAAPRSEAAAQSKDPCRSNTANEVSTRSPRDPRLNPNLPISNSFTAVATAGYDERQ